MQYIFCKVTERWKCNLKFIPFRDNSIQTFLQFEKHLSIFSLLCIFKCLGYIFHEETTSRKNVHALAKIVLDLVQIEWLNIYREPFVIFYDIF